MPSAPCIWFVRRPMIVCFDTSALNQLMDDPDGNRLTSILLRDFAVYITALNIVEIGKTARADRREQLRAFEKHLANGFEPLDLPNQLVQRACLAFHNRAEKIVVTLGEASRQLWVAMSEPHGVSDQERSELTLWANELESSNAAANRVLRPELESIFASDPAARPRTPKQLLWIYMLAGWPVRYRVTAEIYKRATGCILPLSQLDNFLTARPSIWPLYLGAEAYSIYYGAVWGKGLGPRNSAGMLDLWAAVYLPFCDVFVTHDTRRGGQFSALRLLNAFNSRRPRTHIVRWSKFRASLSGRGA
jgi:hypothetical protein